MELEAQDIVFTTDSRDGLAVIGRSDDVGRIHWRFMVGMDEIDVRMSRQSFLEPVFLAEFQLIPAHVGHFQFRVEGHDVAGQETQAVVGAAFVALFKEGLHAQADAHKELAALDLFLQERDEVEFL